ncbi:hypothetical protein C0992_009309, partial [Termitomyces sp. T32_za158]
MFPWLFPYGLGGIGASTGSISTKIHKANLLMYHDKRFQTDTGFPFVAFSHEQVKAATSGGFLATEKANFRDISNRIMSADRSVLTDLAKRLEKGEFVVPQTPEEKVCYQIVKDLDCVDSGHTGLYGDTSAYYGTVEQQGRMTLHLHLLLWIAGGITPDEARQKIMDPNSNFQKELVEYLEAAHRGDFFNGDEHQVKETIDDTKVQSDYIDPTRTLPVPPPNPCS